MIVKWSYSSEKNPVYWTDAKGSAGTFTDDLEDIFQTFKDDKTVPFISQSKTYTGYTVNPVTMKLFITSTYSSQIQIYNLKREMIPKSKEKIVDWDDKYSKWIDDSHIENSFIKPIEKDDPVYTTTKLSSSDNEYKFMNSTFKKSFSSYTHQ